MGDLFQTSQQNISFHIQNIYEEEELAPEATHKKSLSARTEGNQEVKHLLDYHNLDMIISVGSRVKSWVVTRFRIWASEPTRPFYAHVQDRFHFAITDHTAAETSSLKIKNPLPLSYFVKICALCG